MDTRALLCFNSASLGKLVFVNSSEVLVAAGNSVVPVRDGSHVSSNLSPVNADRAICDERWHGGRPPGSVDRIVYDRHSSRLVIAWSPFVQASSVDSRESFLEVYQHPDETRKQLLRHPFAQCVCLEIFANGCYIAGVFRFMNSWRLSLWKLGGNEAADEYVRQDVELPPCSVPVRRVRFPDDCEDHSNAEAAAINLAKPLEFLTFGKSKTVLNFWNEKDSILGSRLTGEPGRFHGYGGVQRNVKCGVQLVKKMWLTNADRGEGAFLLWQRGTAVARVLSPKLDEASELKDDSSLEVTDVVLFKRSDDVKVVIAAGIWNEQAIAVVWDASSFHHGVMSSNAVPSGEIRSVECPAPLRTWHLSSVASSFGLHHVPARIFPTCDENVAGRDVLTVCWSTGDLSRMVFEEQNDEVLVARGHAEIIGLATSTKPDADGLFLVATVGGEGRVLLWNATTLENIGSIEFNSDDVWPTCVAFSPLRTASHGTSPGDATSQFLVVGDSSGCLRTFSVDLKSQRIEQVLVVRPFANPSASVIFSDEGNLCAVTSSTNSCFVFQVGVTNVSSPEFVPLFRLDLKGMPDSKPVEVLVMQAVESGDEASCVLAVWCDQGNSLSIFRIFNEVTTKEDSYLINRDSCRVSRVKMILADEVVHDDSVSDSHRSASVSPISDKHPSFGKILSVVQHPSLKTSLLSLCVSGNTEDSACVVLSIEVCSGTIIFRSTVVNDLSIPPSIGLMQFLPAETQSGELRCGLFLCLVDGTVQFVEGSLVGQEFSVTGTRRFSVHRFGTSSVRYAACIKSKSFSLVTADTAGSVFLSKFGPSSDETISKKPASGRADVTVVDTAISAAMPTLDAARKAELEVKRMKKAEEVTGKKREEIANLREEMMSSKAMNSKLPPAHQLPTQAFQSCAEVFRALEESAASRMEEIKAKWDPVLESVKVYEAKLKYWFLSRWQWDEICARVDFAPCETKSLDVTTWRVERLPAEIYSALNEACERTFKADEVYAQLNFTGRDAKFREFLAKTTGRSEIQGTSEEDRAGIKCCSTIFPGELTVGKKRGELFAARFSFVDYASDFNRKVVELAEKIAIGRKEFDELESHLEIITSELREPLGLADLIVRRNGGGKEALEEFLKDLFVDETCFKMSSVSFESSRSSDSSSVKEDWTDLGVGPSSQVLSGSPVEEEPSVLEQQMLRDRQASVIADILELVKEGGQILETLQTSIARLRAEKVSRAVIKEWGKLRCLELTDQVTAVEPTEEKEKAILQAIRASSEAIVEAKRKVSEAVECLNEKAVDVDEQRKALARIDEEAETAFFAFPKHNDALRSLYRKGTPTTDQGCASSETSRNSFHLPSLPRTSTSRMSITSCPGFEEISELGQRRASAENRLHSAVTAKAEAEAAKKLAADELSRAEAKLAADLRENSNLISAKMAALGGTAVAVVLTSIEAEKMVSLVPVVTWNNWLKGNRYEPTEGGFGAVVISTKDLTKMLRQLASSKAEVEETSAALSATKHELMNAAKISKKLAEKYKKLCGVRDEWITKKFGKLVKLPALEKHLKRRKEERECGKADGQIICQKARRQLESRIKDLESELVAATRANTRRKEKLKRLHDKNREVEAKLGERRKFLAWQARRGQQSKGKDFFTDATRNLLYKVEAQAGYIDQLQLQILAFRSKAIPAPRPLGTGFDMF